MSKQAEGNGTEPRTRLFKKVGKVHLENIEVLSTDNQGDDVAHRIGVNQRVNERLPKLPARKVYASH